MEIVLIVAVWWIMSAVTAGIVEELLGGDSPGPLAIAWPILLFLIVFGFISALLLDAIYEGRLSFIGSVLSKAWNVPSNAGRAIVRSISQRFFK